MELNMENITIGDKYDFSTESVVKDLMNNITKPNTNNTNPKISYITEPKNSKFEDAKRIIAIAYSYDQDKNIKYGASIFKKETKTDICVKSQIRETAIERFNKFPVCFNLKNIYPSKIKFDEIIKEIRIKMYKYGVGGRESILNSIENTNSESDSNLNTNSDTNSNTNLNNLENELNNSDEIESYNSDIHLQPKISYILEPKGSTWHEAQRIIVIVYSYTNEQILYGASIFRRMNQGESCVKSQIRKTATERFFKHPIMLQKNNSSNTKITVNEVLKIIRKTIHTQGVKKI